MLNKVQYVSWLICFFGVIFIDSVQISFHHSSFLPTNAKRSVNNSETSILLSNGETITPLSLQKLLNNTFLSVRSFTTQFGKVSISNNKVLFSDNNTKSIWKQKKSFDLKLITNAGVVQSNKFNGNIDDKRSMFGTLTLSGQIQSYKVFGLSKIPVLLTIQLHLVNNTFQASYFSDYDTQGRLNAQVVSMLSSLQSVLEGAVTGECRLRDARLKQSAAFNDNLRASSEALKRKRLDKIIHPEKYFKGPLSSPGDNQGGVARYTPSSATQARRQVCKTK
jgi:hypothetical protein